MKILLITDTCENNTNGVVTTLKELMRGVYESNNHTITSVSPEQFLTIPCPTYNEIRLTVNPWKVKEYINKEKADIVHIATEGPLGIAARIYCANHCIPFVTSYHTKFPEYIKLRFPFIPISWSYAFMRWFHGPAERTFVTTESMKKELRENDVAKNQTVVWPRGVDTEFFAPTSVKRYSKENEKPTGLYVGRISVEKNLEDFLKLEEINKVVVGDGPDRRKLEKKYPDAQFLGFKYGSELVEAYNKADVFVFPSKTDTFGLVMLEAMACGTPVAAYSVTGPKDIIVEGRNGGTCDDLKLSVRKALKINRQRCRDHTVKTHSWERGVQIYIEALEKIVNFNQSY